MSDVTAYPQLNNLELYINNLKTFSYVKDDIKEFFDKVIDALYEGIISADEQKLIDLAFQKNLSQEQLDAFFKAWDIEAHGADTALLLAYVMKEHPQLTFNDYNAPRLSGVRNFFRFKNLELIAHFKKVMVELGKRGIVPMVIKGGAIKSLRPDLPRVMNDIDILVKNEQEYQTALQVVRDMGYVLYEPENGEGHSTDVHFSEKGTSFLDIHCCMDFNIDNRDELTKAFFDRACKQKVFGCECLIPAKEDMVFLSLFHLAKNLKEGACVEGIPYAAFDLAYLTKDDFNWQIVFDDMRLTNTEVQIYMAINFMNKVFKGSLCEENVLISAEDIVANGFYKDVYYAKFVHEVKHRCKKLKLKNSLHSWADFKFYLKNKSWHSVTKRAYKYNWLRLLFLRFLGA